MRGASAAASPHGPVDPSAQGWLVPEFGPDDVDHVVPRLDEAIVAALLLPVRPLGVAIEGVLRPAIELDDEPLVNQEVNTRVALHPGHRHLLRGSQPHPAQPQPKQALAWALRAWTAEIGQGPCPGCTVQPAHPSSLATQFVGANQPALAGRVGHDDAPVAAQQSSAIDNRAHGICCQDSIDASRFPCTDGPSVQAIARPGLGFAPSTRAG